VYRTGEGRVVLEDPSDEDVARLGELLGEPPLYRKPDGSSYDYYGFGKQDDGDAMIFAHVQVLDIDSTASFDIGEDEGDYPESGDVAPDEDISFNDEAAYTNLKDWFFDELDEAAETQKNGKILPTADDRLANLLDIAKQYIVTVSATIGGKSCMINNYVTGVHSFGPQSDLSGDEPDIYYVRQEGILDGSNDYLHYWAEDWYKTKILPDKGHWWIGQGHIVDNYVEQYAVKNTLELGNAAVNNVQLLDPEPTATNNTSSKTISSEFTIGGNVEVGYSQEEGGKTSAGLSMGGSFGTSYTFEVKDVSINQRMDPLTRSPSWEHNFKIPEQNRAAGQWQRLFPPADLSHTVYRPNHVWIWRLKTADRSYINGFNVGMAVTRGAVLTRYSGSQRPEHLTTTDSAKSMGVIVFPKPPLLALDKDSFVFDNAAHKDAASFVTIGAYKGWSYTVQSGADWVEATKTGNRLFIQVDANTTNAARTAEITVTRDGAPRESAVLTVTQLK
jgi:hypothetical protein